MTEEITHISTAQFSSPRLHETAEERADRMHEEAMHQNDNGAVPDEYSDDTVLGRAYVAQLKPFKGELKGHYTTDEDLVLDAIRMIISWIGDDPDREDLRETPARVLKAYAEMFSAYKQPEPALKWFKSSAHEMVAVRHIDFASTCEHHMLPFYGTADVAYIPNGWVVGVSKIPRLVDGLSRRLQIQESLTDQICTSLTCEQTLGAAVLMRSKHACMGCRGARQPHVEMETTALSGRFKGDAATRAEFLQGVKHG